MTIRFDNWEISPDEHCWVLTEHYMGKKPTKGKTREHWPEVPQTRQTYHPDLHAIARWVLNKGLGQTAATDLRTLVEELRMLEERLGGALREAAKLGAARSEIETRRRMARS